MQVVETQSGRRDPMALGVEAVGGATSISPIVSRYRQLVATAEIAMVIVDGTGKIVLVNGEAEQLFGYTQTQMVGNSVEVLIPHRYRTQHGQDRFDYASDPQLRSMGAEAGVCGRRHDGTEFQAEVTLTPVETPWGSFVSSTIRDVTQRRLTEHSASHFTAVVRSSHDAIIGKDLDGTITNWNPGAERLFGYTEDDVIGRPISLLIPPGRSDEFSGIDQVGDATAWIEEHDTVRARKDGSLVDVAVTISPILGSDGCAVGRSMIARDISDRRKAEQMKDEFLTLVSHELRTPLSSIIAHTELLLEDDLPEDARRRFVAVIERNSGRLERLVGDLLFVAQLESANLSVSMTDVDLVAIALEAVEAASPLARQSGVKVTLEAPESEMPLMGDRGRIGQALDNLISNAIKYSPGGGEVKVALLSAAGAGVVEVSDSGIGIETDDQEHLFERFFRSPSAVGLQIQGVGLGLMVVKSIVDAHGGRVSVTSRLGEGSTFRVELPMQPVNNDVAHAVSGDVSSTEAEGV